MMSDTCKSNTGSGISACLPGLERFFSGRIYPITVVSLALIGHALGLEVITNLVNILLLSAALAVSHSARPIIPYMISAVFQISRINGPGVPNESTYYATGWRLPVIIISFVILLAAIVCFVVKERLYTRAAKRDLSILIPLGIFTVALLLNGVLSPEWTVRSLGYGALIALFLVLPFLLLYYGLAGEDKEELTLYFSYVSSLVAILLFLEVVLVYLAGGAVQDGEIIKEKIVFGWGVWTSMGVALSMLIPAIFIGVIRSRCSFAYLGAATVALVGAVLTQSRGAWLFGLLAYAVCIVICAFVAKHKLLYRILTGVGILAVIVAIIILWDRLPELIGALLNDNGRFELFKIGIEEFTSSPIFGTGFFGFELPDDPLYFKGADFLPALAHQTFIELLSATGIIGLIAYLVYRASTVAALVKNFNVNNCLLFGTALVMLAMSLVDNFFFYFWPTLAYSAALAIMMRDGKGVDPSSECRV